MSKMIPAGIVTAYGAAVRGGYLGTYEEFCAALGDLARVLEEFEGFSVSVTTLDPGEPATADYSDGVLTLGIPAGETGNGIQSAELNQNYTLTLTWTNGESTTVGPIRGATGQTPNLTIGTVETLDPDESATATITGTPEDPVLNLGIPQGEPGQDGASDAGAVTYDPTQTYPDGSVGKEVSQQKNAIGELVLVQDTQPSSPDNRIWVDPDDNEIEIPTMDEFEWLKNAINAVANIPELVWDHSFINEAGNVSLSNYTVLSKKYPCRPGDMIVNNSPSRDDNNIPFVSFLAVYDENGFVERLVNTSSKTRTQILDDGITAFRILFGRSSTTEVQWQDSDFQYLNYAFYLKPESYKDAIDFETEINDRIDSLLIANGESWEG